MLDVKDSRIEQAAGIWMPSRVSFWPFADRGGRHRGYTFGCRRFGKTKTVCEVVVPDGRALVVLRDQSLEAGLTSLDRPAGLDNEGGEGGADSTTEQQCQRDPAQRPVDEDHHRQQGKSRDGAAKL
jgi:hypothetical protein